MTNWCGVSAGSSQVQSRRKFFFPSVLTKADEVAP